MYLHKEDYFSNIVVLSKLKQPNDDVSILQNSSLINSNLNVYVDSKKTITFYNDSCYLSLNKKDIQFPFSVGLPLEQSQIKQDQFMVVELTFKTDSITNLQNDKLCLSISEKGKDAVFFKAENLKDFYNPLKEIHTVYLEFFAGSEYPKWIKQKLNFNLFIDKSKDSHYDIVNFKVKTADYSPTRWTLWD